MRASRWRTEPGDRYAHHVLATVGLLKQRGGLHFDCRLL
jgi:hypothetical protein